MDNPLNLVNQEKIKFLLKSYKDYEIGIFSFAVWDDRDIRIFNNSSRIFIESIHGITISHIVSKRQIFEEIKKSNP